MNGMHRALALAIVPTLLLAGCLGDDTGTPAATKTSMTNDVLESTEDPLDTPAVEPVRNTLARVPTWRVGDNWVYYTEMWDATGGTTETFHRNLVTGVGIKRGDAIAYEVTTFTGESANGPWNYAEMGYVDAATLRDVDGASPATHLEYPLSTGSTWTVDHKVYEVRGTSRAFLPAGDFDVVHVTYGPGGDIIPVGEIDYSNAAKNVVRVEYRGQDGYALERVLVAFNLAG